MAVMLRLCYETALRQGIRLTWPTGLNSLDRVVEASGSREGGPRRDRRQLGSKGSAVVFGRCLIRPHPCAGGCRTGREAGEKSKERSEWWTTLCWREPAGIDRLRGRDDLHRRPGWCRCSQPVERRAGLRQADAGESKAKSLDGGGWFESPQLLAVPVEADSMPSSNRSIVPMTPLAGSCLCRRSRLL